MQADGTLEARQGLGQKTAAAGTAQAALSAPPDLPELQELHLALLKRFEALEPGAKRAEAQALRERVQAAGDWIRPPGERDTAQGIIDYWTSAIAALPGEAFPELLQLAPFGAANLVRLMEHADAALAECRAAGAEEAARLVVLSLTPEVVRTEGRVFSADERAVLASRAAADARERLEAAGLIRRVAASDGAPGYALRHEALLRHWPQFDVWLTGIEAEAAKLRSIVAQARNWEHFNGARSYVLRGKALAEAKAFEGRDPAVDALIKASRRARNQEWTGAGVTLAVVLAMVAGMYALGNYHSEEDLAARYNKGVTAGLTGGSPADAEQQIAISAVSSAVKSNTTASEVAERVNTPLAMWIGNAQVPLLVDRDRNPVDPSLVTEGGRYYARTDIWLRAGMPDKNYASAPEVAVLPRRAMIEATTKPQGYPRPGGVQYWIGAKRIATVFIQYSGAPVGAAEVLRGRLAAAGFDMPAVQQLRTGAGQYEVRYATREDAALAQQVTDELLKAAPPGAASRPKCWLPKATASNRPGVIEIWLDLGAVTSAERARTAAVSCEPAGGSGRPRAKAAVAAVAAE